MSRIITLHPHQDDFYAGIREGLRDHGAVLGQAPTGMGKTVVASKMIKTADSKGFDAMFMVHRKELIQQTSGTFERDGIPHSFIQSGLHHNARMRVSIASVGTLVNRLESIRPPRLLIVDEGHHSTADGWTKCIEWAKANKTKIVGLTATPWRLSGEGLDQHFDHMVMGPKVEWLMNTVNPHTGFTYLSRYRAFTPSAPDMRGVGRDPNGDYSKSETTERMMKRSLVGDIIENYKEHAWGKKTIFFGVNIKHSLAMAEEFNAAGIPAAHIDANTPPPQRRQLIQAFADGLIWVLCNVDLFGEGFDLSAIAGRDVPIECVIQGRPTQSLSLHLQQLGRGLRPKEGFAILLDHAGNIMRHCGLPDSEYPWSLAPREKKAKGAPTEEEKASQVRQCPKCLYAQSSAIPACENCGHVFVTVRKLEHVDGDLLEITKDELKRRAAIQKEMEKNQRERELKGAKSLQELINLGYQRGYAPGKAERWAGHVWTSRKQAREKYRYGR